jgi:hypothetical protein
MGVRPVMGRGFTPDEEKAGAAPVVLLSYALWQSRFGADRRAIGQMIRLDSQTVTIVGVLPQDFRWVQELRWVEKCDVMEPMGMWAAHNDSATDRGDRGDLLGRKQDMSGFSGTASTIRTRPRVGPDRRQAVTSRPLESSDTDGILKLLELLERSVLLAISDDHRAW